MGTGRRSRLKPRPGPSSHRPARTGLPQAASGSHVAHARAPFDGGGMEPVDAQLFADLGQHGQLHLPQARIGGCHLAGKGVGGLAEPFGQGLANEAEKGVEPVLLLEKVEHGLRDTAATTPKTGR